MTIDTEAEDILLALATFGSRGFRSLGYHDRGMVRGRALARLREKYRDEYERLCEVEARKLIAAGEVWR